MINAPAPRRPFFARLSRLVFGCLAIGVVVWLLAQMPYGVLREERLRLFGEVRTTGVVEALRSESAPGEGMRFFVAYKYVDQDGLLQRSESRIEPEVWRRFSPGAKLHVLYARARPELARVGGQIDPPFQMWLRRMLY
ncbi:MAG: DUF3592 domain-containing protein [Pseudodesulfovibrio sp.]